MKTLHSCPNCNASVNIVNDTVSNFNGRSSFVTVVAVRVCCHSCKKESKNVELSRGNYGNAVKKAVELWNKGEIF